MCVTCVYYNETVAGSEKEAPLGTATAGHLRARWPLTQTVLRMRDTCATHIQNAQFAVAMLITTLHTYFLLITISHCYSSQV